MSAGSGPEAPGTSAREGEATEACSIEVHLAAALGADHDPTSVMSGQGVSVAWLDQLGWIVSDFPADVLTYGPDGRFQGRLGERGQGPEEWSRPARVVVDPSDSVWVSDLQGRAIVFAPDGTPARTLTSPRLLPIEGFLEEGRPYSILFHPSPQDRTQGTLLARAWNRASGEAAGDVGPGAVDGSGSPSLTPMLVGPGTAFDGSTLYAAVDSTLWVARWTPAGEDTVSTGAQLRAGLAEAGLEGSHESPHPVDIAPASDGGFWVLGFLRVLSEEEEQALREQESLARGMSPTSLEIAHSPNVRNRVFDGLLVHLTPDGEVNHAIGFDELPFGFVSNGAQFYTLAHTDTGLLQARIWQFERTCDRGS